MREKTRVLGKTSDEHYRTMTSTTAIYYSGIEPADYYITQFKKKLIKIGAQKNTETNFLSFHDVQVNVSILRVLTAFNWISFVKAQPQITFHLINTKT